MAHALTSKKTTQVIFKHIKWSMLINFWYDYTDIKEMKSGTQLKTWAFGVIIHV